MFDLHGLEVVGGGRKGDGSDRREHADEHACEVYDLLPEKAEPVLCPEYLHQGLGRLPDNELGT